MTSTGAPKTRLPAGRLLLVGCALTIAAAVSYLIVPQKAQDRSSSPDPSSLRPPGPPDRPHVLVTENNELAAVQHKDASGLSPLEIVITPQGPVRIQRTFRTDGSLIKEEAFLDGRSVPVPARPPRR